MAGDEVWYALAQPPLEADVSRTIDLQSTYVDEPYGIFTKNALLLLV